MISEVVRFESNKPKVADSEEEWAAFLEQAYYAHAVQAGRDGYISGLIDKRRVGDLGVSRHSANSHAISRAAKHVALDHVEQHALVFVTSGKIECAQRGRFELAPRGSLYVLNASEPFEVVTDNATSTSTITIPSDVCRAFSRNIDELVCNPIGDPLINETIVGLIDGIFKADIKADPRWLSQVCGSLLDALLNPRFSEDTRKSWRTSEAARGVLLRAVRKQISEQLHLSNFNISIAANANKVSARHLQNIFESVGTTFTRELLEARLHRASLMLRSPSRGTKRVGQIAIECGFVNAAHFSTTYKKRFGLSPVEEESEELSITIP